MFLLDFRDNLDENNTGSQLEKGSILMNIMVHCNGGGGLIEARVSSGLGRAAQKYEPMELTFPQ